MPKELTIENISLPVGWEKKPLGEVCEINPKKSEVNSFPANHLVSFLPMKDLGVAQNQINPITIKQFSEVKGSYTYFRNNDVLLAKVTPCFENGKLGIAKNLKNEIGFGSSEYIVFRPKNEILSEYLFYILSSSKFRNRGKELMYGAVGLKRLSKDYVKNFITPFPSIDKQKQIVAILDQAFAAIDTAKANAEQNLQNAKELFESYLQNVFENKGDDWEEKSFGETFKLKSGNGLTAKNMISGKYPVFGGNGIAGYHNEYNFENEVIIGRVGALCGNVRFINECFWLTDNAFRISVGLDDFNNNFVVYMLNHKDLRDYARQAAQPVISNSSLKDVRINFPNSIKEQEQIVEKLDSLVREIKKLEAIYTQKIADLEEMKKSVLQKAFSGQLNTIN